MENEKIIENAFHNIKRWNSKKIAEKSIKQYIDGLLVSHFNKNYIEDNVIIFANCEILVVNKVTYFYRFFNYEYEAINYCLDRIRDKSSYENIF